MTTPKIRTLLLLVMAIASSSHAITQGYESDWDTYMMQVQGRPVSVVLDMGLRPVAPMPGRPFAVLIRTRIPKPQPNGLPGAQESARLDSLEEQLAHTLEGEWGDVYAGRFTHRGIRTFHFFTADTIGKAAALHRSFAAFPEFEWLARCVADSTWSNYLEALYPPPRERELMRDRRLIDQLSRQGDPLIQPRRIDHYLRFPSKIARMEFLRQPGMEAFTVAAMPEADSSLNGMPYLLHLQRNDVPDQRFVERVIVPLRDKAAHLRGRYEGWETYLLK